MAFILEEEQQPSTGRYMLDEGPDTSINTWNPLNYGLEPTTVGAGRGLGLFAQNMLSLPGNVMDILGSAVGLISGMDPVQTDVIPTTRRVEDVTGLRPSLPSAMETSPEVQSRYAERTAEFLPIGKASTNILQALGSEYLGEKYGEKGKWVGMLSPIALEKGGNMVLRGSLRGASPEQMQQRLKILDAAGVDTPTAGVASGKDFTIGSEAFAMKTPGGVSRFQDAAQAMSKGMANKVDDLAGSLSAMNQPVEAGESILKGLDDFSQRLGTRYRAAIAPVDAALGAQPIKVDNFARVLREAGSPVKGMEELSVTLGAKDPKLIQAATNLDDILLRGNGAVPYESLRQMRSAIGEKLTNPQFFDDISRQTYKKLYAALSEDIRIAARTAGVETAFNDANKIFSGGAELLEKTLKTVGGKTIAEDAYAAAISNAQRGPTKLKALKATLSPEQFDDFRAVVVGGLGKNKQGHFTPDLFLSHYDGLNPASKDVLFGTSGGLRKNLDTVAEAATMMKKVASQYANPPETAKSIGLIAMGSSLPTAFAFILNGNWRVGASLIGGAVGLSTMASAGADMMTNQTFVRWLAESTKLVDSQLPGHAARLIAASKMEKDPEKRAWMQEFGSQFIGPRQIYSQQ